MTLAVKKVGDEGGGEGEGVKNDFLCTCFESGWRHYNFFSSADEKS